MAYFSLNEMNSTNPLPSVWCEIACVRASMSICGYVCHYMTMCGVSNTNKNKSNWAIKNGKDWFYQILFVWCALVSNYPRLKIKWWDEIWVVVQW
jgi:hypothetical protein